MGFIWPVSLVPRFTRRTPSINYVRMHIIYQKSSKIDILRLHFCNIDVIITGAKITIKSSAACSSNSSHRMHLSHIQEVTVVWKHADTQ